MFFMNEWKAFCSGFYSWINWVWLWGVAVDPKLLMYSDVDCLSPLVSCKQILTYPKWRCVNLASQITHDWPTNCLQLGPSRRSSVKLVLRLLLGWFECLQYAEQVLSTLYLLLILKIAFQSWLVMLPSSQIRRNWLPRRLNNFLNVIQEVVKLIFQHKQLSDSRAFSHPRQRDIFPHPWPCPLVTLESSL